MDQRVALNKLLVDLLRKINTSIQKTSCYVTQNTFSLDSDGAAEISAIGGALSFLGVLTVVPGTTDGLSGASGSLDSQPGCVSSADGLPAVSGNINIETELGSSAIEVAGISGTLGVLDVSFNLVGSAAGISGGEGFLNHNLLGSGEAAAGVGGGSAELDVLTELVGDTIAESSASGGTLYLVL